jgi:hypothetical protein
VNAWLLDKCIAYAKAHRDPELTGQTVWEVFEAERPKLVPYAGRFDGFHAVPASVSKTFLVRIGNNKYSVAASAVGRPVRVHAYADRIVIRQDGRIVAEHPRSFGRGDTIYDPWHYVPVLARKPGALRKGVPFKDWVLPAATMATGRCRHTHCGAHRRAAGGRGGLRRGNRPRRPLRRRRPQHSGPPAISGFWIEMANELRLPGAPRPARGAGKGASHCRPLSLTRHSATFRA